MNNLNEHIIRMKELFEVKHGIILPLISEQDPNIGTVTQSVRGKDNPDILFDRSYNDYLPVNANQEKKILAKNPNFNTQLAELKKHPTYKSLIEKIKDNSEMMTIFFFYLNQTSRVQFLDQTLEFLRSFTKKRKLEKRLEADPNYTGEAELYGWSASLVEGELTKTKVPQTTPGEDSIEVEIPLQISGKTVYKDNSNEPDEALNTAITKWVSNVNTEFNNAKSVEPTATAELISIDIASSCSRLRNTGGYVGKTWNQLSKDRAEKVYELLTAKLSEIGITVSSSIQKILRGGYNGDGSSGPDPAMKFVFDNGKKTNNMSYSTNGADQLFGSDEKRKKFSYPALLPDQETSHQYKFCVVIAKIKIKANTSKVEPLQPKTIYSQGYSLELTPLYKGDFKKQKPMKLKRMKGAYKGKGGNDSPILRKIPSVKAALENCPAYTS